MREPWLERHVIPIAQLKAWLALIAAGPVRQPFVLLTRDEEAELRRDLEAAELV